MIKPSLTTLNHHFWSGFPRFSWLVAQAVAAFAAQLSGTVTGVTALAAQLCEARGAG